MRNEQFLCNLTNLFWKYYLLEPTKEHFEEMFSIFSPQIVSIGTGKHEYFTCLEQAAINMAKDQSMVKSICFQVLDEWEECLWVSQDVYLVYGGLRALQCETDGIESLIDMDTRFSFLYRKQNEKWEILHIHHSIPSLEQQDGEYYPKTLSEKAKYAMVIAELFPKKSEMNLMTGVFNNESFKLRVQEHLKICDRGNMYLFDLDYFKQINDTYGHMVGDEVLKLFSDFLKQNFDSNAIIGRLGGDEFFVFEYLPFDREQTIQKMISIRKYFEESPRGYSIIIYQATLLVLHPLVNQNILMINSFTILIMHFIMQSILVVKLIIGTMIEVVGSVQTNWKND